MTIIPKKDYWNCEMWNYKEPNWNVENMIKKKKSLLRNFGEKAQGSWYPFHMFLSKSISLDCGEYCLGLTKRRTLPEGEIHILFAH